MSTSDYFDQISNEELVLHCQDGNKAAWDVFMRKFTPMVRSYARQRLSHTNWGCSLWKELIDEFTAYVFETIYSEGKLNSYDPTVAEFQPYWKVLLRSFWSDFNTKAYKLRAGHESLDEEWESESGSPLESLLDSEKRKVIVDCIRQVPVQMRFPVVAIHFEIFNYEFDEEEKNYLSDLGKLPPGEVAQRLEELIRERVSLIPLLCEVLGCSANAFYVRKKRAYERIGPLLAKVLGL